MTVVDPITLWCRIFHTEQQIREIKQNKPVKPNCFARWRDPKVNKVTDFWSSFPKFDLAAFIHYIGQQQHSLVKNRNNRFKFCRQLHCRAVLSFFSFPSFLFLLPFLNPSLPPSIPQFNFLYICIYFKFQGNNSVKKNMLIFFLTILNPALPEK